MRNNNSSQDFNRHAAKHKQAAKQAFNSHTKVGVLSGLGAGLLMSVFLAPSFMPEPPEEIKNSPVKVQQHEDVTKKLAFVVGIGLTLASMGVGGGVGMATGLRKVSKIMRETPKP